MNERYLVKRIARWAILVWVMTTVVFLLFRVSPGDPLGFLVGGSFTEETKQQILANFGLDEPLHIQYLLFLENLLLRGEFGMSFHYGEPVLEIIIPRLINSMFITVLALVLVMIVSYLLGSRVGWKKGERFDQCISYGVVAVRALPHFVLGIVLLMIFSTWLDWFPTGGMYPLETGQIPYSQMITDLTFYKHLFLPFLAMFLFFLADPFLLMRGNIINEKSEDYISLYQLKGLSDTQIRKHASRNALLPLISYITPAVAIAFGGQILLEIVFSWPGIGRELVDSVHRNDYPMAQGIFFIIGFCIITANLVVDVFYMYVDPRIRYD